MLALAGLSLFLSLIAGLCISISANDMNSVERISSWLFVSSMTFIAITAIVATRALVHPYIMFLGTFTLFLGGRFVAYILGFSAPVFGTHWVSDALSPSDGAQAAAGLLCAAFAIHAGYLAVSALTVVTPAKSSEWGVSGRSESLLLPAAIILALSAGLSAYGMWEQFAACREGGYQEIYRSELDVALRGATAGSYGLFIGAGLAFASRKRTLEIIALVLLGVFFVGYLWLGVRGGILAFLLMVGWIVSKKLTTNWALGVFLIIVSLLYPISQLSSAFGCRSIPNQHMARNEMTPATKAEVGSVEKRVTLYKSRISLGPLMAFCHEQGSTMVYTQLARRVPEYPWPAYFQTVVPGFAVMMSLAGHPQKLSDLYFGHHMALEINPEYYGRNQTMGWSLIADFVVLSGRRVLPYLTLAAAFGAFLCYFFRVATLNAFAFGALVCVFAKLMILPRAGLYSIFPFLFVYFGIVVAWGLLLDLLQRSAIGLPQRLRTLLGLGKVPGERLMKGPL